LKKGPQARSVACVVIRQMGSEDDLRRAEELVAEARRIVQQQKGRIIRLRRKAA
jgi:hypothetical protein